MRSIAILGTLFAIPSMAFGAEPVDYRKDIRPVLQARCFACHGALNQKGKLRVDSIAALAARGVIEPGQPADSELYRRVSSTDAKTRMPPEGHALSAEQIAKIKAWIEQGAKAPSNDKPEEDPRDHWSFRTPVRPNVPKANFANPIDAFVAAKWAEQGLPPVPPADKRILLRRVSLDLVGVPPSPGETAAFLKDASPDAYEKLVDRLLASPQYGERWGRHFLDIWRYSDWWGLGAELRNSQKHIWHWRDWTVESFNADLGYDEMIRQMLAADELYPTDAKKLRATGFLARSYFLFNRSTWLEDTVEHTSKGFLGLTFNCAKCHDHKYDPTSQVNYYQFRAFFEPYQVRTDFVNGELDVEKAGLPRAFDCNLDARTFLFIRGDERNPDKARAIVPALPVYLAPNGLKIAAVKLPVEAYAPGLRPDIIAAHRKQAEAKLAAAERGTASLRGLMALAPPAAGWPRSERQAKALAVARAELDKVSQAAAHPGDPKFALRGSVKSRENNLESDASRAKPFPTTSSGRRTALANWIADRTNPLTARVAVNHLWMRHFGQPLVATVFDFGRKGTPPTHPELLDWLAVELMEHRWSLKHLHRLMVTSRVYRLSSSTKDAETNVSRDEANRWQWRMNPQRMQAHTVRDNLLHLAGELDSAMGGPPVPLAQQETSRRRAMYFFHSHNDHHKFLDLFDDANVLECYRRSESIVPQQGLALWNSGFALRMAGKITERLQKQLGSADDAAFARGAFELVLGTSPTPEELTISLESLEELRTALKSLPEAERTRRARMQLVQALVNHNDFVTVR